MRVSSHSVNDTKWLEYFENTRGIPKSIGVRLGLICLIVRDNYLVQVFYFYLLLK